LLAPLAAMASKHKVAVVAVTHLNKAQQANALYRASGSLAFVAAARAAYGVTKDPDNPDRRLILPLKNNLGDDRTGFAYSIIEADNGAPVLAWEDEPVEMTLEDIANAVTERKPRPRDEAKNWLKEILAQGPRLATDIEKLGQARGFSEITIRRARQDLRIKPNKRFDKRWEWGLPATGEDLSYLRKVIKDDQIPPAKNVNTFGESDHLGDTVDPKAITSVEDDHKTGRGKVITFDGDAYLPGALISAAITACDGLKLEPRRLLEELDPADHQDIMADPETARAFAESLAGRLS
jgi:hypothetical protein